MIGAGAGGLVTAAHARGIGLKVALIERNMLGGDCLNNGCVPSKALLKCANVAYMAKTEAKEFGIECSGVTVDFEKVMERMRKIRAQIAENDSVERFEKSLGVNVFLGSAKFTAKDKVWVNKKELTFKKAVIATGGRPRIPNIPGLEKIPFLTSDSVFNLRQLPRRLLIIGGGPIAAELGQAFQRLGSEVVFMIRGHKFMPREDRDMVFFVEDQLKSDGCVIRDQDSIVKIELIRSKGQTDDGQQVIRAVFRCDD